MKVAVASIVFSALLASCVPIPVLENPYSASELPDYKLEEALVVVFKNDEDLAFDPKMKWDISVNGKSVTTIFEDTYTTIKLGVGNYTIKASKGKFLSDSSVARFISNLLGSHKNTVGPSLELEIDKPGLVEYVRLSLRSKAVLVGMEIIDNVAVGRYIVSDAILQRMDKEEADALLRNTRLIARAKGLSD